MIGNNKTKKKNYQQNAESIRAFAKTWYGGWHNDTIVVVEKKVIG